MDNRPVSCRFRDLYENGFLVEGSAVLSRQHLNKAIPYKYVVVKGQSSVYEYIYKPQQSHEHVNRCLQVKAELLCSGGESPAGPLAPGSGVPTLGLPKWPGLCRAGVPVGTLGWHCPCPCPWALAPDLQLCTEETQVQKPVFDQCNGTAHFPGETRKRTFTHRQRG